jgi:hypothetical protein
MELLLVRGDSWLRRQIARSADHLGPIGSSGDRPTEHDLVERLLDLQRGVIARLGDVAKDLDRLSADAQPTRSLVDSARELIGEAWRLESKKRAVLARPFPDELGMGD